MSLLEWYLQGFAVGSGLATAVVGYQILRFLFNSD